MDLTPAVVVRPGGQYPKYTGGQEFSLVPLILHAVRCTRFYMSQPSPCSLLELRFCWAGVLDNVHVNRELALVESREAGGANCRSGEEGHLN